MIIHVECGVLSKEKSTQAPFFWPVATVEVLPYLLSLNHLPCTLVFTSTTAISLFFNPKIRHWKIPITAWVNILFAAVGTTSAAGISYEIKDKLNLVLHQEKIIVPKETVGLEATLPLCPSQPTYVLGAAGGHSAMVAAKWPTVQFCPLYRLERLNSLAFCASLFSKFPLPSNVPGKSTSFVFHCASGFSQKAALDLLQAYFGVPAAADLPNAISFAPKGATAGRVMARNGIFK